MNYTSQEVSAFNPLNYKPVVATLVNNNQAGWLNIIETAPNVTIPVGTKLIVCPHPLLSHDCCVWCGLNMAASILGALSKQVGTAHTLSTTYGDLPLDTELSVVIEQAIRPILEARLKRLQP